MADPDAQLENFLAKFLPEIAATGRTSLVKLRALLPEYDALAYDNYNSLATTFSPNGKPGSAMLSLAVYPRWVSLFVGASLNDPGRILKGNGTKVRHIVLAGGDGDLDRPDIADLIRQTRERAGSLLRHGRQGQLVIQSISAKQRPRRPA